MSQTNEGLLNLLKMVGLSSNDELNCGKLEKLLINKETMTWTFSLHFESVLSIDNIKLLTTKLHERFVATDEIKRVKLNYIYDNNMLPDNMLEDYYLYILEKLCEAEPLTERIKAFNYQISNQQITFYVGSEEDKYLVQEPMNKIKRSFEVFGLKHIILDCSISQFEMPLEKTIEINLKKATAESLHQDAMFQIASQSNQQEEKAAKVYKKPRAKIGINGAVTLLKDLPVSESQLIAYEQMHEKAYFVVQGDVIKTEIREFTNAKMYKAVITDGTDSIPIKSFINSHNRLTEAFFLEHCKLGMNLRIYGQLKYDTYDRELVLNIFDVISNGVVPKKFRNDLSFEKRVELHAHTKMSSQDGVMDVEAYAELAAHFGHQAIAVTDHHNIQGLPDLEKAAAKYGIKPIFGLEGSFVRETDYVIALTNEEEDIPLDTATYVVYDVETTGFSSNYDEIIEIAAVKIKNGLIVEEFSELIKPRKPIPAFITNLTHISNDDVRNCLGIEEILPKFKQFFQGTILVAHNATFDNSMIYANLKRLNIYDGLIPTIDTLQLARIRYKNQLKKFNLKAVAKFFDVELVQHHRAIYDTRATGQFFIRMLQDLKDDKIRTYQQINSIITDDDFRTVIPTHITLLSKNRIGIKNLNKIVSDSCTVHFEKEPRIIKSFLDKHRDGILVGSSCLNGEVFDIALNKSEEELREVINYYDYLEVQPPYYYYHMFERVTANENEIDADDTVANALEEEIRIEHEKNIKKTLKKIIHVGRELGKIVVATGDVHHLNKEDRVLREVFIDAPQVGGGRHILSRAKEVPSQHFMSTDEMLEQFSFLDDELAKEIVITNTNKIAAMIEQYSLFPKELFAPKDDFMKDRGVPSFKEACTNLTFDTAKSRYGDPLPKYIVDRITKELNSIIGNNYASIYYISHLLVKHSKDAGYVVGSRGSVGSSLVATFMGITEVNALPPHYYCPNCHFTALKLGPEDKAKYIQDAKVADFEGVLHEVGTGYDLPNANCPYCNTLMERDGCDIPFETFLGFKGDKVPDIDLNFSGEYQNRAHDFAKELFGENYAFRAGTIGTVAAVTAFGYVKNFLERKGIEARRCEIDRISQNIIGVKRSTGQHPGGIVVVPHQIEYTDVIPVQYPSDNTESAWRTTHYDYHKFESNLLKLDILGHDDPTMIRHLMDFVEQDPERFPFHTVEEIPLSNEKVLGLFSSTNPLKVDSSVISEVVGTTGLPEFGTKLAKDMLRDIRPKTVDDLIKISGLSHGKGVWAGNAKDYLLGTVPGVEPIPFKDLIGCRDDIMVVLMEKGLPASDAFKIMENVRKGKGVSADQEKLMLKHQVPDWYIRSCKLIEYMFPKAHAAAYVIMALRIGWFKVHSPIHYYAAFFSRRAVAFDVFTMVRGYEHIKIKLAELNELIVSRKAKPKEAEIYDTLLLALEMTARGYQFKQINLNKSDWRDFIIEGDALYIPFKAMDSLGDNTAKSIVEARSQMAFTSKRDFIKRTKVNATLFEKLDQMDLFEGLPDDDQIGLF